jgi:hypothetical protein
MVHALADCGMLVLYPPFLAAALQTRLQVYEAAAAEAMPGGMSEKERALLRRLQQSLGISAADAAAIEDDLGRRASIGSGRPIQAGGPA